MATEKAETSSNSDEFKELFAKHKGLSKRQQQFLKAYSNRMLNTAAACRVAGISRTTAYEWAHTSDTFKRAKTEIEENFFDGIETTIFSKAVVEKDNTMLIFLAKTKMKQRGYIETVENNVSLNAFEQALKNLPDLPEE